MKKLCLFMMTLLIALMLAAGACAEILKISLVGDCTMGGPAFSRVEKKQGLAHFFSGLAEVFYQDDLTLANCEGSLTNRTRNAGHEFNLSGPPEYAQAFTLGSVEAVNIANNHTYDFFEGGRQDTIAALEAEGIGWFGEGDLFIAEVKGVRIGMTGYTGFSRSELKNQERDIALLRAKGCDLVIVSMHWGTEKSYEINQIQREAGPRLIDMGADIVFGHGPHVLQPIEIYKGKPIIYSLANFSFGANTSPRDPDTAALCLEYEIGEKGLYLSKIKAIPCQMHHQKDFRPYEVTDQAKREKIFKKLVFSESSKMDSGLPESFLTTGEAGFPPPEAQEAAAFRLSAPDTVCAYEAGMKKAATMYKEASSKSGKVMKVKKDSRVQVLSWDEEWSLCEQNGKQGYIQSEALGYFRSLKPFEEQRPGYEPPAGYAEAMEPVSLSVKGYAGNTLSPGDLIVLEEYGDILCRVGLYRTSLSLSSGCFEFTPFVPWDAAGSGQVIGGATTYYNEKSGGKLAQQRKHNIDLAVRRLNGTVVLPGERFSFNGICAPYRQSNGYLQAPVLPKETKKVWGGGVSQAATAVYQALLCTPLYIEQWSAHGPKGAAYTDPETDCLVDAEKDLVFINCLPYSVTIEAKDQNGVVTVLIRAGEDARSQYLSLE